MPRIRYIKPDFFKDEDLAALPLVDRITFAGLWCHADREGRLEYRPRYLKAELWPYDAVDMEAVLNHLATPDVPGRPDKTFIIIYEVDNRKFIQIVEFLKHQRPHHTEQRSSFPPIPDGPLPVEPPLPHGALTVGQPLSHGALTVEQQEGMGMEKGMERVEPEVSTPESDQCLLLTEQFWNIYPHRNGFKISKQETLAAIRKHVSREDCSLLLQATKNFAESPDAKKGIGVKDPHRFIVCGRGKEKSHPWREWINPERTSAVNNIPEYKRQPA